MSLIHRSDMLVATTIFIMVLMALVMLKVYLIGLEKYEAQEVPPQEIQQKENAAHILIRATILTGIFTFTAIIMIRMYRKMRW